MQFAIFGGLRCEEEKKNECSECRIDASGMQGTFLLMNSKYSSDNAASWEKDVFIRNVKSFNKALGNDYHTELDEGLEYNQELMDEVAAVLANFTSMEIPLMTLKADYLAERSIPDNI
mmetsp:Transcript_42759/g.65718  ORF Transcript_42759/g.65718 Transcript_42759/m.65718 type:complete len:118 (+) Transcript_42759:610-963(+)